MARKILFGITYLFKTEGQNFANTQLPCNFVRTAAIKKLFLCTLPTQTLRVIQLVNAPIIVKHVTSNSNIDLIFLYKNNLLI